MTAAALVWRVAALLLPMLVRGGPPRWRAITSSSSHYFYSDYSLPGKPHAKGSKFMPGPQFCPDTGRTLCKTVPHYPDEHIFSLVSGVGGKSRRPFNFSSLFVDERDGDALPDPKALPDKPPSSPRHDGYVVYQTAVHYDYAPSPWAYSAGSPVALRRRRRRLGKGRVVRRQAAGQEAEGGVGACRARTRFVPPSAALNDRGEWKFVVNLQHKDPKVRQVIRVETCQSPGSPCSGEISLGWGRTSSCRQKFIKKQLLSLDGDGRGTSLDSFFVPSCCVCHLHSSTSTSRRKKR